MFLLLFFGNTAIASPSAQKTKPESTIRACEKTGHRALQEVKWRWKPALSKWNIQFHPARKGYLGMTSTSTNHIDIWVRVSQSPKNVAEVIVHELAHAFDHEYLDAPRRKVWLKARNIPIDTLWFSKCDGCSDYRFGSGDFAECASFTVQGSMDVFRSKLGPPPNKSQQALIRKWLNELPQTNGK